MAGPDREALRARALELGFQACGFCDAAPLECGPILADWTSRGRHGSMGYLAADPARRLDPALHLDGARTVLVALWRYRPPPPPRLDWRAALVGRIAAYALGPDYHDHLGVRMAELGEEIVRRYGARYALHVDAGPLVEKDLAVRAGLGWYGRNTNVLSTDVGSYFLIACLVTDAVFDPDAPTTTSHCGTCTACIPACPTGALDDGPTIDAARCISYLTIEHRGPLAHDLRPQMNNWVFGCDVCQEVCPWHDAVVGSDVGLADDDPLYPSLPTLLTLDEDGFRDRYRHTAVWRAKRRGLARNAAVALGNSANAAAAEPLGAALRDHDEPLVRAHAAWALGRIGGAVARAQLEAAAAREPVPPARRDVERALAELDRAAHASSRPREHLP